MASVSIAHYPKPSDPVNQGDIFSDVKYTYIDEEHSEKIEIVEFVFPYAIVLSQACDVAYMNLFETDQKNDPVKFMPGIIMCPIYDSDVADKAEHLREIFEKTKRSLSNPVLYTKRDREFAKLDQHVRFHSLQVQSKEKEIIISDAVIDFKHVFTVSMKQLRSDCSKKRLCTLDPLYATQISNKLYSFISRVGLPD